MDLSTIVAICAAVISGLGLLAGWIAWIVRIERVLTSIRDHVTRQFDDEVHGSLSNRVKRHSDILKIHDDDMAKLGQAVALIKAWLEMDESVASELKSLIRIAELRAKTKRGKTDEE